MPAARTEKVADAPVFTATPAGCVTIEGADGVWSTVTTAAALVTDLKQRGLLDDTLILWTTEFGRMPSTQGGKGRDHNPYVFTNWLAGGGIKGGVHTKSHHGIGDVYLTIGEELLKTKLAFPTAREKISAIV